MGINRPSLYGTFGDKQQLFVRCLEHYADTVVAEHVSLLDSHDDWLEATSKFLSKWAKTFTDSDQPGGCLVASHLGVEGLDKAIEEHLQRLSHDRDQCLIGRLVLAKNVGQLIDEASPAAIAQTIGCFHSGMSAMSRMGTNRRQLLTSIACFSEMLEVWK